MCRLDVADWLALLASLPPIIVFSSNSTTALGMKMALADAGVERVTQLFDLASIKYDWFAAVKGLLKWDSRRPSVRGFTQGLPEL